MRTLPTSSIRLPEDVVCWKEVMGHQIGGGSVKRANCEMISGLPRMDKKS